MSETTRSILLGTSGLSVVFVLSVALAVLRPPREARAGKDLLRPFLVGIGLQALHTIEEYVGGLPDLLPEVVGLPPWPAEFFVVFNVAWLAIWVLSAAGVRAGVRVAWMPVWFFALGMVLNLIMHPLLALRAGGYFPGLYTAPFVGVAGVLVLVRLLAATEPGRKRP